MASEKSSLLDRNHSTNNSALSVPISSEDAKEDAVTNPFTASKTSERASEAASTHHQSLTSSDPREILFALERAADLLRGQVEEDEQNHRVR